MRKTLLGFALGLLAACDGDHGPGFLPLNRLCEAIAEEVCSARRNCCEADPGDDCEAQLENGCNPALEELTSETSLRYDAERADRVRDDLRLGLDDCEPPLALEQFFEGGAAVGATCERDSQCTSGVCSEGSCAEPTPTPLCE